MKNIKLIVLTALSLFTTTVFAQTGTYSTRTISADGKTSIWAFDVVSGSAVTIADNTEDNGIIYVNGGGSNKAQTSKYMSFNKSELYIEVPAGSAGNIGIVPSSSSDSRYFQLYINGTEGTESQRIWSKAGDGTDGKKGPQSFDFTSADITTKNSKSYLHLKTNNTEMKITSFTIVLTTGSYEGGGGDTPGGDTPGGGDTPTVEEDLLIKGTIQKVASGLAAGSVETNIDASKAKLDKKKYFGLILKDGYTLQANDTFIIHITTAANLGQFMLYADKDGNENLYDEEIIYSTDNPSITGEKKILLPAAVAGKKAIYLWREDGNTQWNPVFDYVAIKREGLTPPPSSQVAVESVSLDKKTLSLEAGKTETLTATVLPANATNKSISWSSNNTAIATVVGGVVTGVAEGETNIIVETADGGFKDSCKVTVKKKSEPVDPPTPSGNSIFDWIIAGSSKIENDETDLRQANYGTLNVGTSVTGRILGSSPIEYNTKGYKLANNDVCIEIQGTSAFQAGDIVTITGVCGGSGERGFTVAPSSSTSASSGDILLTNLIESTEVNNFTATITNNQAGEKLRIFRLAGKTMYLSAIKVERNDSTPTPPEKSHDATLKSLVYGSDQTSVPGFSAEQLSYSVVLPSNYVGGAPSIQAVANDTNARVDLTQASSLPGTAKALVTAEDGTTKKTYTVNFSVEGTEPPATIAVTGVTLTPTTATVKVGASVTLTATVQPDNADNQNVTWSSDKTGVATVSSGVVTGVTAGKAVIKVTTEDGGYTATCTVTVEKETPHIVTDLDLHLPEKYEASTIAGGYNTPLTEIGGREYEVYYTEHTDKTKYPTFSTTPVEECKTEGISGSTSETKNEGREGDKWFEGTIASTSECKSASSKDEFVFASKTIREHRLGATDTYQFHVKGFDQFSLWGMDKKIDPKNGNQVFVVKVDGKEQPTDESLYNKDNYTIRRYDITTDEHLIEISTTCSGSNVCYMGGFSLRVAQEPRTKWLKGNDSTQNLVPFGAIQPVTYVTKYNNISGAETKLEWIGDTVDGLGLKEIEGDLTDTLVLNGTANAPAGEYHYAVVAYFNGKETTRAEGKFKIHYEINAITKTDVSADQGEEIDEIKCRYYVYDETKDIIVKWNPEAGAPGIKTSAKNGIFSISGTPTTVGTYAYLVTVEGGDTVQGTIHVESSDLGENPVLYLYKNKMDYIYDYLKESGYNLKAKCAKDSSMRSAEQYAKYKWVLISENVDANSMEVFHILRGGSRLPVLNMKAFSYSFAVDSLPYYGEAWGVADNGSISENGKSITVWRDDHPIFKSLGKKQGDTIQVLDSINRRGLMPVKVTKTGGLCLATAWTRDREDYYGDGARETFIHEIPAGMSGNDAKYISLPISMNSSLYLTEEGKELLKATIAYLTNDKPSVARPELKISQFKVLDKTGTIYEGMDGKNTITLEIDSTLYPDTDWTHIVPEIEVASPYTYAVCEKCESDSIDLLIAQYIPIEYVVTDYIHRVSYDVKVAWRKAQGIEEVYSVGDWVNVYDIFGRKVATTNEDIYTMSLPRGVYIIVTENGQTLKISR